MATQQNCDIYVRRLITCEVGRRSAQVQQHGAGVSPPASECGRYPEPGLGPGWHTLRGVARDRPRRQPNLREAMERNSMGGRGKRGVHQGGGVSGTPGASRLAAGWPCTRTGGPCVAWQDAASGDEEIYVRSFDGTRWLEVGAGSAAGGGISGGLSASPSLAMAVQGTIFAAWADESSGNSEIYVRRWPGLAVQGYPLTEEFLSTAGFASTPPSLVYVDAAKLTGGAGKCLRSATRRACSPAPSRA